MRPDKLSVVLVLCMTVPGVVTAAQEQKKPITTETVSLQNKGPEEPTILELQRAAIRYAEVSPDKIRNWRRQAAMKAFLPELSVGYDKDVDATITSATSSGKTNYTIGPDDTSYGWDVSLKWDLGDLVYNDDQTSIDSRSKLMVQLRNDVLEKLNQAYFERKRLQAELAKYPDNTSPAYQERELKIEELTAQMDALTGGYFSRHKISLDK